jgi:hypothetical protein
MNTKYMNRSGNILILLITVILSAGSCKNIFRKDFSMTVKEYAAKGMPDINRPWSEQDLMKAHIALGSVRTKSFNSLPRKESSKSGAVFSRITGRDNLSFLNDSSIALRDKAYRIQTMASFINEISRMYTDNLKPEQYYNEELIEVFIYEIYVREKMLELAEKIMNSKEPGDISMGRGRQSIVNGYVNLITTLIRNQEKTKAFSTRELKRLNSEVATSISKNIRFLDAGSKQKISDEIKSITEKNRSGFIREDYVNVLKALDG